MKTICLSPRQLQSRMLSIYAAAAATGIALYLHLEFSGSTTSTQASRINPVVATRSLLGLPSATQARLTPVALNTSLEHDDPVRRYRAGRTPTERLQALNDFMVLGHEKNVLMLAEAVRDSDPTVRMFAVQNAANLTPGQGIEVYRKGAVSTDAEVRAMTWSLVGPHSEEGRAAVYREALLQGSPQVVEEALQQMTTQPGKMLFEMMLQQAASTSSANAARLLQELRAWLVPGGGQVPNFQNVSEMKTWWAATSRSYDSFMLRMDQ